MALSDSFVSVVAPVCNDSTIVESFISETMNILEENYENYELVFVDDASDDDTVAKITLLLTKFNCMRLIRLSRRFGEEIAISAALDSAIGDFVVVLLPNFDPPQLIPKIIQQAQQSTGIVYGIRNNREGDSLLLRAGAALFYWYCEKILKLNLPKKTTQFRALSRQAVNAIMQIKVRQRYLRILISYVGFANESFVYEQINRSGKPRKKSLLEAVNLAVNIIFASRHPLRIVSLIGVLASIINLIYTGFIIRTYFFGDSVAQGWIRFSLQSAVMFFFVFLILTILSEYIGHIFIESENRPLYYVIEERTSAVLVADQARRNVARDSMQDRLATPMIDD